MYCKARATASKICLKRSLFGLQNSRLSSTLRADAQTTGEIQGADKMNSSELGNTRHGIDQSAKAVEVGEGIIDTMFNQTCTTITYKLSAAQDSPITVAFSNVFLRDASTSKSSIEQSSSQKLFTTGSLLINKASTIPKSLKISEDRASLEVGWCDGDKCSYPLEFIHKYAGIQTMKTKSRHKPVLWDKELLKTRMDALLSIDYETFISKDGDNKLYQTLVNLQKYGISFVTNIPKMNEADASVSYVKKIAERIDHVKHTFYGETFDVVNKEDAAENIAYTNIPLPLHMDLLYLESVPGWQLLHAIKNSSGDSDSGMNYFVDAFHAARYVRDTDSDAYNALLLMPINYGYVRDDRRYHQSRPLIEEHEFGEGNSLSSQFNELVKCINYSPPFQKPFTHGIWEKPKGINVTTPHGKLTERFVFRDFQRGLALFEKYINSPENHFRVKLPEGTCAIFNNRRILHARTGFSGERWLQGCYMDGDSVQSKLLFFEEKFGY